MRNGGNSIREDMDLDGSNPIDGTRQQDIQQERDSSSSIDSKALKLEKQRPSMSGVILDGSENPSETVSSELFGDNKQAISSEKSMEVRVKTEQTEESHQKAIVDYSDSEINDSIDELPLAKLKEILAKADERTSNKMLTNETQLNTGTNKEKSRVACEWCHMTFSRKVNLDRHLLAKHKKKLRRRLTL